MQATNSAGSDTKSLSITIASLFVPVSNITDVPTTVSIGTFTLSGKVVPDDAFNQTIVWSVVSAGGTGATISGNTLNTTAEGTVTVRATISNGTAI